MDRRRTIVDKKGLSLLSLFAALAVVGTASARLSSGFPPQLGKLCGSVNGATWRFQGQTGTRYNVIAKTPTMCTAGMKAVSGLTKQTPRAGTLGAHSLSGPRGFHCLSTLAPAHSGFCGGTAPSSIFYWAPRLKT